MEESNQNIYVCFISFDKEKSTRFPGIINKLAQQLSQYIEVSAQKFIDQLNGNIEGEQLVEERQYNLWRFIWKLKSREIREFLIKHPYIGTKQLRLFFSVDNYVQQDFQYENLDKMQIYNVRRISSQNESQGAKQQGGSHHSNWKGGNRDNKGDLFLSRNPSSKKNYEEQQQPEPTTYEEYLERCEQMKEKLVELKQLNKELRDSNSILDDAIYTLEETMSGQSQYLGQVKTLLQEPLELLHPDKKLEREERERKQKEESEEQQNLKQQEEIQIQNKEENNDSAQNN